MFTPAPTLPEVAAIAPPIMRPLVSEDAVTSTFPPSSSMITPSPISALVSPPVNTMDTEPASAPVVLAPAVIAPAMDSV